MTDVSAYWVTEQDEPSPEQIAREAAAELVVARAFGPNPSVSNWQRVLP